MKRAALVLVAALAAGMASAQSPFTGARPAAGVQVQVYLSQTGLGLLALPKVALAAVATSSIERPQQTVAGLLNSVDGGATSQGWYMRAALAAPSVVNLGALNLTWQRSGGSATSPAADLLGVRLGVLNTTVPMVCDGLPRVVLQLDTQTGDYGLGLSKVGGLSNAAAARVEYICAR